jgi:hypothetical protein
MLVDDTLYFTVDERPRLAVVIKEIESRTRTALGFVAERTRELNEARGAALHLVHDLYVQAVARHVVVEAVNDSDPYTEPQDIPYEDYLVEADEAARQHLEKAWAGEVGFLRLTADMCDNLRELWGLTPAETLADRRSYHSSLADLYGPFDLNDPLGTLPEDIAAELRPLVEASAVLAAGAPFSLNRGQIAELLEEALTSRAFATGKRRVRLG